MEEKIIDILSEISDGIVTYEGNNLFEAGLLDSFLVIDLVSELEEQFNIEIDAKYIVEDNFKNKESIIAFMEKLATGPQ